jgi:hypothetical protein
VTDSSPGPPSTTLVAGPRSGERSPSQLLRGSPREVLERISRGDPLGLERRVEQELARRCLLLDEERVLLRTWARCARYARRLRRRQGLDGWLRRQVSAAVDDLICEDDAPCLGARWSGLAEELALAPGELAVACASFNRLCLRTRMVFFRTVLEGNELEALLYAGGPSLVELAREVRRGLLVFFEVIDSVDDREVQP